MAQRPSTRRACPSRDEEFDEDLEVDLYGDSGDDPDVLDGMTDAFEALLERHDRLIRVGDPGGFTIAGDNDEDDLDDSDTDTPAAHDDSDED
jgi:hypothetical protein